jgi:hypothetical protein
VVLDKCWATFISNQGLENIYFSGSDYPPLYYYILALFDSLKGSEQAILEYTYELKYITLLFEFGSVILIFKFIKEELRSFFYFCNVKSRILILQCDMGTG